MLRLSLITAAIGISLLAIMTPGRGEAARATSTQRFTANTAGAGFEITVPSGVPGIGGLAGFIDVFATGGVITSGTDAGETFGDLSVNATLFDSNTQEPVYNCFFHSHQPPADLVISQRLTSASLDTVVSLECFTFEGGDPITLDLHVDLDWTPSGGTFSGRFKSQNDEFSATSTSRGVDASASGSLTFGTSELQVESDFGHLAIDHGSVRCFVEECFFFGENPPE